MIKPTGLMKHPLKGISYFWQQTSFCGGVTDCSGIPVVYYKTDNHFPRQHKNTSWLFTEAERRFMKFRTKKSGVVIDAWNPSDGEVGGWSLGLTVQPAQPNGWALAQRTRDRPLRNSKKTRWAVPRWMTPVFVLWSPHTCIYMCM